MTAVEVAQKKDEMPADEWDRFFDANIQDITVFPIVSYEIEATISNSETLLVSERDGRLNDIHAAIKAFLLEMKPETAAADTLEADVLAEFERLSALYSDDQITVDCRIQSIEREMV
ncbi:MAG: hypothetical protein GXY32_07650 [Ruminococcaceae bacterium]|nr:hypothetical protein [Oscillospiraceae bacterium]